MKTSKLTGGKRFVLWLDKLDLPNRGGYFMNFKRKNTVIQVGDESTNYQINSLFFLYIYRKYAIFVP